MTRRTQVVMRFDKRLGVPEQKLLIPNTNTVGVIMQRVRERFLHDNKRVTKHVALFLFFSTDKEQRMFPVSMALEDIAKEMGGPDYLLIDVGMENAFGRLPGADSALRPRRPCKA